MKVHSQAFKNGISKLGRQLRSRITYTLNGDNIELGNAQLNSINPSYETSLLKSVMRYIEIDSNVDIPVDTIFRYELGLKIGNTYEYIDFGNYVVKEVENKEDTHSYIIKAYDKMLYAMKNYEPIEIQYPCTVRDYIAALADQIGLEFENEDDEFVNYDKLINEDLYVNLKYTYRDVLDELSQVTASNICINSNDKLEVRYFTNTNDTIDEHYLKNINVNFGKTFGPINTIVLSRAGESDSIYGEDTESVEDNGRCELKIIENQIMNFNDRDTYIPEILEQLDGLEFSINDFDSTGVCYYDVCDMYNVDIGENTYQCIMLNDSIEITQGLSESIYTKEPEETNTDYNKSDKTDNRINETWIIANKQEGEITALTSRVQTTEDALGNVYTKQEVFEMVQTAETGITTTFSEAGGNNIFRNTGLWFENNDSNTSQQNPYEFWSGIAEKEENIKASNRAIIILQNGNFSQTQNVANGNYTVSFKYKKLVGLANVSVNINGTNYELSSTSDTEFMQLLEITTNNITVNFISDTNNACEIYDLMVNAGKTKLAYSQNQNETTTDTVNISKGIEITSSETNTKFRADTDGIRIYNTRSSNSEPTTEYTETGTKTNTLEVKDEATILQVKWQLVGDQTWLTRL